MLKRAAIATSLVLLAGPAAAQTFKEGLYGYKGSDGLPNNLYIANAGSNQQAISENINLDLSRITGCKLHVNVQTGVMIPDAYNSKDFLKRQFRACSWTVNQCGTIQPCEASMMTINDAQYARQRANVCVTYRAPDGSASTAHCYSPLTPVRARTSKKPLPIGSVSVNVPLKR